MACKGNKTKTNQSTGKGTKTKSGKCNKGGKKC